MCLRAVLGLPLLPNCLVGQFHHCPYPPARDWGSRVYGLVFSFFESSSFSSSSSSSSRATAPPLNSHIHHGLRPIIRREKSTFSSSQGEFTRRITNGDNTFYLEEDKRRKNGTIRYAEARFDHEEKKKHKTNCHIVAFLPNIMYLYVRRRWRKMMYSTREFP